MLVRSASSSINKTSVQNISDDNTVAVCLKSLGTVKKKKLFIK